jgi:hypothetical protein
MLKITVVSPALRRQPYISKKDGKPGELFFQTVYVHTVGQDGTPAPFPEKVETIAERDAAGQPIAHAAGEYTLHPSAVFVNREGRLDASLRLTPLRKGGGTA